MEREKFKSIEGLRAYLALWVAIGHGLQLSGYLTLHPPYNILLQGGAAVAVFMIVSGFVITHLLLTSEEGYLHYITRRAFRLYPAYAFACVVGYLVMGLWPQIIVLAPWRSVEGWTQYGDNVRSIAQQTYTNTLPHLVAHATMLHSAIPYEILPQSASTFLPAAWSISLEWQFYLVAPLLLLARRTFFAAVSTAIFIALGYWVTSKGYLGTFAYHAFLFSSIFYFLVGIASRLCFRKLRDGNLPTKTLATVIMATVTLSSVEPTAYFVWFAFYIALTFIPAGSRVSELFDAIFENRIVGLGGKISYSIYLLHRPAQVAMGFAVLSFVEINRPTMFAVQLLAIAVTIPFAYVVYRLIEKPGIAFGRLVAERYFNRPDRTILA